MYPNNVSIKSLNSRESQILHNTMDSTALAGIILDRLHSSVPTSVIRESDGEQCIIQAGQGKELRNFLKDEKWLTKYGVLGSDLKHVANELIRAGNSATYFGAPIAGLWLPKYDIYQHFPNRNNFISVFYHREWARNNLIGDIMQAGKVMVLHRDHEEVAANLQERFNTTSIYSAKLGSWRDQPAAEEEVKRSPAKLILASGGPTGKAFMVDLAEKYGKVVLDVGNGMTKSWCQSFTESIER